MRQLNAEMWVLETEKYKLLYRAIFSYKEDSANKSCWIKTLKETEKYVQISNTPKKSTLYYLAAAAS